MSGSNSGSSGIGFGGALTILFIGLKLANIIDWSWWWVLCPIWAVFAVLILVIAFVSGVALSKSLFGGKKNEQ